MRYLKGIAVLFAISFLISSCSISKTRTVNRSFYYWKSGFLLTERDVSMLRALEINRIYLKFFDVAWENAPVPAAQVRFNSPVPVFIAIIPTIFITNETLTKVTTAQAEDLAEKITGKINRMVAKNHLGPIHEIQIDSDWTQATRDSYFALLRAVRARLAPQKIILSATIRLHQIKYRSLTGVPPVDRGMLMFYNLAPVNQFNTQNSIIDLNVGKAYVATLNSYPLPLDAALPIFSWGVVFQDDHFIGLANNFHRSDLIHDTRFEKAEDGAGPNVFRVKRDVFLHHTQLYRDDLIRVEESDSAVLKECAAYLGHRITGNGPVSVALFHFDRQNLRGFGHAQIASVFDCFR